MSELITRISEDLLLPPSGILYLIKTAPYRYKTFKIDKKQSLQKRTIAQPAKEIKLLQRWVIKHIFSKKPIHPCATAYKKGSSIRSNALPHMGNDYILKLDFKNFFPSISHTNICDYLKNQFSQYSNEDQEYLATLLTWCPNRKTNPTQKILAIGAPSSPLISNLILFKFDTSLYEECNQRRVMYTRYADDLTFSAQTRFHLEDIQTLVKNILGNISYLNLTINTQKTILTKKPNRRYITGVYISNEDKISLGRERKRSIRVEAHHYKNGKLSPQQLQHFKGMLAFAKSIEPEFIQRLKNKYGTLPIN